MDFLALVLLEETRLEDFAARPPDCFFPPRPAELVDVRLDVLELAPADFFPLRPALVAELPDAVFRLEGGPPEPPFRADPLDEDFPAVVLAEDRLPVADLSAVDADLRPPPPFCADRDEGAPDRLLDVVPPLVSSVSSPSSRPAELSETPESCSSKTLPPPPPMPDFVPPAVAVLIAALSRLAFVEPFGLPRFPRTTPPPNTSSSSSSSSISSDSVTRPSSSSSSSTSSALSHRRSL